MEDTYQNFHHEIHGSVMIVQEYYPDQSNLPPPAHIEGGGFLWNIH
jgi:hypothetical protein